MTDGSSKKTHLFLQSGSRELQLMLEKVKELTEIQAKIATYLDPGITSYCQVGNLQGKRLTFIVANGSIATQIRFQTLDLLRKFKQDPALQMIQEIHCKVRPAATSSRARKQRANMQPITEKTAAIMEDMADGLKDPKLKEIMLRIAKRKR